MKYKQKYKQIKQIQQIQQIQNGGDTCGATGKEAQEMKGIQSEMKKQQGKSDDEATSLIHRERRKGQKIKHTCTGTKRNKDGSWSFPSGCKPSMATNAPPQTPYPIGMLPKVFRRDCEPCAITEKSICQNNCDAQCNRDPYYMGYCFVNNRMTQMLAQKMNMKMMSGMGGMGMMGMGMGF